MVKRKEFTCDVGDLGSIPGLGRSPGEGNGYQLQYSGLENSMDRGDRQATVHGVTHDWATFTFTFRYADDISLMAESEEELKSLWIRVKEQNGKAGLKVNIQKTKIMPSSPITLWQIVGKTMEIVTDFIFLGSKITADGDCSHETKRHCSLLPKLWPT